MSNRDELARAFASAVDEYERGRPGYPREAVAWIADACGLGPGRTVLDLGAGTGKLTRLFAETGAGLVAVDPLPEMLAKLREMVPEAETHVGRAEEIPLADASVDAVTIAQAFHWLDVTPALREIRRVLRPGGGLAVLWNSRDDSHELERRVTEALGARKGGPRRDDVDPRETVAGSGLFGNVEHRTFEHVHEVDDDAFVDRFTSVSFVAAMPADERARLVERLRAAVVGAPRPLTIHYVTDVYVAFGT